MGSRFGPKVGYLESLSAVLPPLTLATHLQLLAVPPANLWTVVSCDLGIYFVVCLHDYVPDHAIYISKHLVCHFASSS